MSRARRRRGGFRTTGSQIVPTALATPTATGTWSARCPYCRVTHEHDEIGVVISTCRVRRGPVMLIAAAEERTA